MQRIIACESRRLPLLCTEWCFDGCTANSIRQVCASGTPCWHVENGCTLCITLPVSVQLCDPCGRCFSHSASIEAETALPHAFRDGLADPRSALLILPCIRLIRSEPGCGGCFRVQLDVSLDLYLLRYEAMSCGQPKPPCPQLPLYPSPMC